jgi:ubiquinone biosynthesis protein COQ4
MEHMQTNNRSPKALASSNVRVIEAARSILSVLRDPDDTKQVFRLLQAVSGGGRNAFHARFETSRGGERLLAQKPELLPVLRDRDRLGAMPEGSLGHAYLAFMNRDGLTADGLVDASETVRKTRGNANQAYIDSRLRDSHDLWHVVTGYGGDLIGETALLAFTYAQTWSAGVGMLMSIGFLKGDPDARRVVVDAFMRGSRAAWLPAVPWEEMMEQPLESVRAQLRVGAAAVYEPFYARDLPKGGLWAS